ncbi:Uncharacterised protein [Mycobacteroides abscessus subsp. abscessus]|nr:Uncharacterised protein [Mycobacteroides abscessus subsp. abscessus]
MLNVNIRTVNSEMLDTARDPDHLRSLAPFSLGPSN